MRVRVHYNLHTLIWSVVALSGQNKGKVIHRSKYVELGGDIKFHVGEKSRQKVIANKCRSVHAYISGELLAVGNELLSIPRGDATSISYNPYHAGHFYTRVGKLPVLHADRVTFWADGKGMNVCSAEGHGITPEDIKAVTTFGADACIEAYRLNVEEGEGVSTIGHNFVHDQHEMWGERLIEAGRKFSEVAA